MNNVFLVGNIARDMYFNPDGGHPLLRLLLFSSYPPSFRKLRIVLLDGRAKGFYSSLRKGSELGIIGQIRTHEHDHNSITEVEAKNLALIRDFSWAEVEKHEMLVESGSGRIFTKGKIGSRVDFEWRQMKQGKFLGVNDQYAFMRFSLFNKSCSEGLRVAGYGPIAEMVFPYLTPTSEIVVDGVLRQDQQGKQVAVLENIALLRNIDYIRAAAAHARRAQMGDIYDQEEYPCTHRSWSVP
jgi:hypothetical protein